MSLRDLLVLAAGYGAVPFALFSPFFGLLVYSWFAYMRPQDLAWGVANQHRLSLYLGLAMLLGVVFHARRERLLSWMPQTVLLLVFLGWISVTYWQAVLPEAGKEIYGIYWKSILVAVLTTGLVRTRERFRMLMLVVAGSLGLLGLKYAVFGLARGGARFHDGPGGFMNDNNGFASALAMAVPLLVGVAMAERRPLLRTGALTLAGAAVLTIVFTFSRGGFLTLAVVVAMLLLRSNKKLLAALALALGLGLFLGAVGPEVRSAYTERIGSIAEYEEDRSAMGRIEVWKISLRVFRDHPLTGVGPNNFVVVFPRYADPEEFLVAHNSYLQLLAECGAPGLLLFLLMMAVTLLRLERLRHRSGDDWAEGWASMLQISLVGYLVASLTLNRAYFDLVYHLIAASACLELTAATAAQRSEAEAPATPWWRQPRTEAA